MRWRSAVRAAEKSTLTPTKRSGSGPLRRRDTMAPFLCALLVLLVTLSQVSGAPSPDDEQLFRAFEGWLANVAGYNITRDFNLAFTSDPDLTGGRGRGVVAASDIRQGEMCIQVPVALAMGPDGMLPVIKGVRYHETQTTETHTGRNGGGKLAYNGVDEGDEADAEAIGLRLAYEASLGKTSQYAPYVDLLGWPERRPKCGVDTLLLVGKSLISTKLEPGEVSSEATEGAAEASQAKKAAVEAEEEEEDPIQNPAVLAELRGTTIKEEIDRMRSLHIASLNRMEAAAKRIGGPFDAVPTAELRPLLHWALHNVKSRAHRGIGLVPVMDMLNDDLASEIPTLYGPKPGTEDDHDSRMLGFECSRDYAPGDEVRYSYTGAGGGVRSTVIQFGYLPDDSDEGRREYGPATRAIIRLAVRERWQQQQEEEDTSDAAIYRRRREQQKHLYDQWDL